MGMCKMLRFCQVKDCYCETLRYYCTVRTPFCKALMHTYVYMYVRMCGAHLFLNDGSQVQLLLGPQHEVLSHHHANKHGRHGQQAVWPEGLDD